MIYLPNAIKTVIRSMLRSLGHEISPVQIGQDLFRDLPRLIGARPAPIIFDVGANEGQTTDRILRAFPSAEVHAFEPGTEAYSRLAQAHRSTNVRMNNIALGAQKAKLPFFNNEASQMSSFLRLGPDGGGAVQDEKLTAVSTVDDYCKSHAIRGIDLLKTDTQGFDLEVLKGAKLLISEHRIHLIYLEVIFTRMYENMPQLDRIFSFLAERGFMLVAFYDFHYSNNRAEFCDALFINPHYQL